MKSLRNRTRKDLIGFALFLLFFASTLVGYAGRANERRNIYEEDACRGASSVEASAKYNDYEITISRTDDGLCALLDIERGGEPLFHAEEIGTHFDFGSEWQASVPAFDKITGKGIPTLLISEWTGGAHCCFLLHVFEVGDDFQKVATIDGGNYYPLLHDRSRLFRSKGTGTQCNQKSLAEPASWQRWLHRQLSEGSA